ncbi:hypothetical protein KJ656_10290, partial [bacterium]|nr:hypothetical protein [bacterium]
GKMDKIFSARLDESIIHHISNLARQLNTSKKQIIEKAIILFASKIENEHNTDVFKQTFGSWHREESANQLVKKARDIFNNSMHRYDD